MLECEKIFDIKWEKVPKVEERLEKLRERVFIVCRNQYKKGLITDKKIEKDMKSIKKTYKGSKVEKGPSSLRTLFFCCGHDD